MTSQSFIRMHFSLLLISCAFIIAGTAFSKTISSHNHQIFNFYGSFTNIAGSGDMVAISTDNNELVFIDISNPELPVLIEVYQLENSIFDIEIRNEYLFVACGESGLVIVSIQELPGAEIVAIFENFPGNDDFSSEMIDVSGDYLYSAVDTSLTIIDISNPVEPAVPGVHHNNETIRNISVGQGICLLTSRFYGMFIVGITNPEQPVEEGHWDSRTDDADISGDLVYVIANHFEQAEFAVVNISDPQNPELLGNHLTLAGYDWELDYTQLARLDEFVYVTYEVTDPFGEESYGFKVFNAGDESDPAVTNDYESDLLIIDLMVVEEYLYNISADQLCIYDLSNPSIPVEIGNFTNVDELPGISSIPQQFEIVSIYPNPFNSAQYVVYSVDKPIKIQISIFNSLGRLILSEEREINYPGSHSFKWHSTGLAAGKYWINLRDQHRSIVEGVIYLR